MATTTRQDELLQKLQALRASQPPVQVAQVSSPSTLPSTDTSNVDPARAKMLLDRLKTIRAQSAPKPSLIDDPELGMKIAKGIGNAVIGAGKAIAKPFVQTALTAVAAGEDAGNLALGNKDAVSRTKVGYDVPLFGHMTPSKIGQDITIQKDANGNEVMSGGGFGRNTLDVVGTGAQIASTLSAGIGAQSVAPSIAEGAVKDAAIKGGIAGFGTGALHGFSNIGDPNSTPESVIGHTAGEGALGALIGAGTGALAARFSPAGLKAAADKAAQAKATDVAMLDNKIPDVDVATKRLDANGNIVVDKPAKEAVRQGVSKADVALIRSGSDVDKRKMLDMLDIRTNQLSNKRITDRATDVVGKTVVDDLAKPLEELNSDAGKQLNVVAQSLKGEQLDPADAVNALANKLEQAGVTVNEDGSLNFAGSNFEGLKGPQDMLQNVWNRAQKLIETGDAFDAHQTKSYIDEVVNYGKQVEGLSGKAQYILKSFRHDLDGLLDTQFQDYNLANTQYSDTIKQLDQMGTAIGRSFKLGDSFSDSQAGLAMRRLLSNTQSRSEILKMLDGMQGTLEKYGIKVNQDVITQANFADILEKTLGSEAPTSFLGQGERAAEHGVGALSELMNGNLIRGTIKAGKFVLDVTRGVTDANRLKALRELLQSEIGGALSNIK